MADPVAEHQEQVAAALQTFHIDLPETALTRAIDPVIAWLGKVSAVIWPILVITITVNVVMRYVVGRGLVEEIKRRVPVWKREHYADGTREWVDPTRPHETAGAP